MLYINKRIFGTLSIVLLALMLVFLSTNNNDIKAQEIDIDVGQKLDLTDSIEIKYEDLIISYADQHDTGKNDRSIISKVIQVAPETIPSDWVNGRYPKYYFNIPDGYRALYKPYSHEEDWSWIEDRVITITHGKNSVWDFKADGVRLDFQSMTNNADEKYWAKIYLYEDNVKLFTNSAHTGFVPYEGLVTTGTRVLDNHSITIQDGRLSSGQRHEWYYDQEYTIPVGLDDLVTDDTYIYGKKYTYDDLIVINFDTRGGLEIPPIERKGSDYGIPSMATYYTLIDIGLSVKDLPKPTRDGYVFERWLHDKHTPGDGYTVANNTQFRGNNLKFYALWVPIDEPIKIIFANPPGRGTLDFPRIDGYELGRPYFNITPGTTIPEELLPTVTANPIYDFIGFGIDLSIPLNYDTTIRPEYKEYSHFNVTYNTNGGIAIPKESLEWEHKLGTEQFKSRLPIPKRARYAFDGWYLDPEYTIEVPETINTRLEENRKFYNTTVYAKWVWNAVRVNFEVNWPGNEMSSIVRDKGFVLVSTVPPARPGYDFVGWFYDLELTVEYVGQELYEDEVTLYAAWTKKYNPPIEVPPEDIPPADDTNYTTILYVILGIGLFLLIFAGTKKKKRRR